MGLTGWYLSESLSSAGTWNSFKAGVSHVSPLGTEEAVSFWAQPAPQEEVQKPNLETQINELELWRHAGEGLGAGKPGKPLFGSVCGDSY